MWCVQRYGWRRCSYVWELHDRQLEDLTVAISGNLGADGGGTHVTAEYSSGQWSGYMSSVCAAGDPSVTHLWVTTSQLQMVIAHKFNACLRPFVCLRINLHKDAIVTATHTSMHECVLHIHANTDT